MSKSAFWGKLTNFFSGNRINNARQMLDKATANANPATLARRQARIDKINQLRDQARANGGKPVAGDSGGVRLRERQPGAIKENISAEENIAKLKESMNNGNWRSADAAVRDARNAMAEASNIGKTRMAMAGAGAAAGLGGTGVAGYSLGQGAGESNAAEQYQKQLAEQTRNAFNMGHQTAQSQAGGAGLLDRLAYLFTGSGSSLNMKNPIG